MTAHRIIRIAGVFACLAGAATISVLAGLTLGCDKSPGVTGPSNFLGPAVLSVTSIAPVAARPGSTVRILGAGFTAGATVTMGGVAARILSSNNFSTIDVIAPDHDAGSVDVVVTNPGARTVTLAGAFRFTTVTISVSANEVTAGSELTVSWIVPDQGESSLVRGAEDAIGLWRINSDKYVLDRGKRQEPPRAHERLTLPTSRASTSSSTRTSTT